MAAGLKMAILSNKPDDPTKQIVARLLPHWRFAAVLGARPDVPKKPDPSAALEIAGRLDIPPREFLFLGDTPVDMITAADSGMYGVGACWGFRTENELLSGGARKLVRKPLELLSLI